MPYHIRLAREFDIGKRDWNHEENSIPSLPLTNLRPTVGMEEEKYKTRQKSLEAKENVLEGHHHPQMQEQVGDEGVSWFECGGRNTSISLQPASAPPTPVRGKRSQENERTCSDVQSWLLVLLEPAGLHRRKQRQKGRRWTLSLKRWTMIAVEARRNLAKVLFSSLRNTYTRVSYSQRVHKQLITIRQGYNHCLIEKQQTGIGK